MNKSVENQVRINDEIKQHPAWMGHTAGLIVEKLLERAAQPYFFVLREGENEFAVEGLNRTNYYVSYLHRDGMVRHQPFYVTVEGETWGYTNGVGLGPLKNSVSIDDVVHLMMHCEAYEAVPFIHIEAV